MAKQIQDAYIVAALRTPVGKAPRGVLRFARPDDLLAHVIRQALGSLPGLDPALISDCVVGCAFPEAEQGLNLARMGALLAGLPHTVAGITVNRYCASGLNAVQIAADRIRLGEAEVVIAGGAESMSMVPMLGNKVALNPAIFCQDEHIAMAYGMGLTAEKVAQQWAVSREDQDAFALESHHRALEAADRGAFAAEIAPYEAVHRQPDLSQGKVRTSRCLLAQDEGPRRDTSQAGLAALKPVFDARGSVTPGNSSQMSDGAAALVLVSERVLKQFGLQPLARYASFAVRGVPPEIMGIGPLEAVPPACAQAGVSQDALKWIELNEAFAAQALAVIRGLELSPARVNPHGGAIALGHPLGATGAIRLATLIHGMRGAGVAGYGMVTMCVGAGMGAAGVFEVM
jgi:acetyl-CoA acyltransferase